MLYKLLIAGLTQRKIEHYMGSQEEALFEANRLHVMFQSTGSLYVTIWVYSVNREGLLREEAKYSTK